MIVTVTPIPHGRAIHIFKNRDDLISDANAVITTKTQVFEISEAAFNEVKDSPDRFLLLVDSHLAMLEENSSTASH